MAARPARRLIRPRVAAIAAAGLALGALWVPAAPRAAALGLLPVADAYTAVHDRARVVGAPGVLANDLNLLGASAILDSQPSHGAVTMAANGGFTYTPDAGYVGPDTFRYHPSGLLVISTAVTITVVNTRPVAMPDAYAGPKAHDLVVPAPGVLLNDVDADGDALIAELDGGISNGSLELQPDGSFVYEVSDSFSGVTSFEYRVWDGVAWSSPTTVTITIAPALPTPTPTPAPTATPTPKPTPSATPRPTPTPTPRPTPPSIPRPTTTPTPTPKPNPTATPTAPAATPGSTPRPTPTLAQPPNSAAPAATPTPAPSGSPEPSPFPAPTVDGGGGTGGGPGSSSGDAGSGGAGAPVGPARPGDSFQLPGDGAIDLDDASFAGFGEFEWAVPALVLTVPGLLLILAVLAQAGFGLFWLPLARRRLAGIGVRPSEAAITR